MSTRVALLKDINGMDQTFRAVAGGNQAMGRTAGEALDALTASLPDEEADTLIIVRNLGPDRYFNARQHERLEELMSRWRAARDASETLPLEDQAELESLIDAELRAATERAAAIRRDLAP